MEDQVNDAKFVYIILFFVIYFLPAMNASLRKHYSSKAIFALNFFLGWTLIGWIWAAVWSQTGNAPLSRRQERAELRSQERMEKYAGKRARRRVKNEGPPSTNEMGG